MTYRDTEYLKISGNNRDRVSQTKVNLGPKETCLRYSKIFFMESFFCLNTSYQEIYTA